MTTEEKAIVVTETYYVISFYMYEHNCEKTEYKYTDFNEAVSQLKEIEYMQPYKLRFSKITEDKFDVDYLLNNGQTN